MTTPRLLLPTLGPLVCKADLASHKALRSASIYRLLQLFVHTSWPSSCFYGRICYRPSVCTSDGCIIEKRLKLGLWNFHRTVAPSLYFCG